jgi:hypothetical protein
VRLVVVVMVVVGVVVVVRSGWMVGIVEYKLA